MDVILTALMILLMLAALVLLARGWPTSSRLGGYRARMRGGTRDDVVRTPERGEAIREDDDAHWRWDDPGRGGPVSRGTGDS